MKIRTCQTRGKGREKGVSEGPKERNTFRD